MATSAPTRMNALRHAALQASLAPSIHNTQPWRFVIEDNVLELWSDRSRQLSVLDPTQRQLLISCGCALLNARVALASRGFEPTIERLPDEGQEDLLARLTVPDDQADWVPLAELDEEIVRRQTNRRRFEDEEVTPAVLHALISAAQQEGAVLSRVQDRERREMLAQLTQRADAIENADPAYRAELRLWTSDDPQRRDGVAAMVVPHVTGEAHDDVPIRDFDTRGFGWLPSATRSSVDQCLLILGTVEETRLAWLKTGEALERVWLEATRANYVASLFTQVIEVPGTREQLRSGLDLMIHPHVVIRIGRASRTPASRRRGLDELLSYRQS